MLSCLSLWSFSGKERKKERWFLIIIFNVEAMDIQSETDAAFKNVF